MGEKLTPPSPKKCVIWKDKFGDYSLNDTNNEWHEDRGMVEISYDWKEHRPEIYYQVKIYYLYKVGLFVNH